MFHSCSFVFVLTCSHSFSVVHVHFCVYAFVFTCTSSYSQWYALVLIVLTCFQLYALIFSYMHSFSVVCTCFQLDAHFQFYALVFSWMHSFTIAISRASRARVRRLPVSRARSLVAPVLSRLFPPFACIQPSKAALARALFDTVHSLLQHWSNMLDLSCRLSCTIPLAPCNVPSLVLA